MLGSTCLLLVIVVGNFALALAQTETDTSTSTSTEFAAKAVYEAPSTSTPETTTPVAEEAVATTTEETVTPPMSEAVSTVIVEPPPVTQESGSKVSVDLDCRTSYVGDLYNTLSGHLEEGYFLDFVPATTTGQVAQKIGTQAWAVCYDDAGIPHEFILTEQEYANLAKSNATMPKKSIMVPIVQ